MGSVSKDSTSQPVDDEGLFAAAKPPIQDYQNLLLDTLDRLGCGGLIFDQNNKLIGTNRVAVDILTRRSNLSTDNFELVAAVKTLLQSIELERARGEAAWVSVGQELDHPLAIFRVPSGDSLVLIIVDI